MVSVALSGILAQGQRLAASANNIANVATVGTLPTPESPASTVYKPLQVTFLSNNTENSAGGVTAQVSEDPEGYSAVFDPSSTYANTEGLVAAPNVDLNREYVNIIETKLQYKANVAAFRIEEEMTREMLNILT